MLVKKKEGIWCCLQMSTLEIVFCFVFVDIDKKKISLTTDTEIEKIRV